MLSPRLGIAVAVEVAGAVERGFEKKKGGNDIRLAARLQERIKGMS